MVLSQIKHPLTAPLKISYYAAFWCTVVSVQVCAAMRCSPHDWLAVAVWCDAGIPSGGLLLLWCGLHWLPCLWKHDWRSDSVLPGTPNLGCVSCISHGHHPRVRQLPGELRSALIHSVMLQLAQSPSGQSASLVAVFCLFVMLILHACVKNVSAMSIGQYSDWQLLLLHHVCVFTQVSHMPISLYFVAGVCNACV